ncbi:hypothetical protein FJA49_07735 [Flavobacterium microcysteis]|uniref:Lipoprotein n=2 Tax=Flavobacterium microcysteis TaxID=2596891 RepID=A0A501QA56_9FLAO|nr:hypothetical protein FJA49_07735 [Flavobacterium microcysteis]
MTRILYILLLSISFIGCSTPKFYTEIATMQKEIRDDIDKAEGNPQNEVRIKGYNMNKLVLKKMRNELKNTNHILYYYSPDPSFSSNKFWFIIYDVDNKVYYNIENNDFNNKQIDLIEKTDKLSEKFALFVFNNYMNNNCELLKSKGNVNISGVRTYEAIYEINLTNKENKHCYFKNFLLMN